jgi:hypothetical protein
VSVPPLLLITSLCICNVLYFVVSVSPLLLLTLLCICNVLYFVVSVSPLLLLTLLCICNVLYFLVYVSPLLITSLCICNVLYFLVYVSPLLLLTLLCICNVLYFLVYVSSLLFLLPSLHPHLFISFTPFNIRRRRLYLPPGWGRILTGLDTDMQKLVSLHLLLGSVSGLNTSPYPTVPVHGSVYAAPSTHACAQCASFTI